MGKKSRRQRPASGGETEPSGEANGTKTTWSRGKAERCFACNGEICAAFEKDGKYEVNGGGMCGFLASGATGPLVRDIQFNPVDDFKREWNVQINSNAELVDDGGCPADAKAIILTALEAVRVTNIMPFTCSLCAKPCKNRKCSRCKKAVYCSAECQKTHWKAHKAQCQELGATYVDISDLDEAARKMKRFLAGEEEDEPVSGEPVKSFLVYGADGDDGKEVGGVRVPPGCPL